jgi:hypothetical protein
LKRDLEKAKVLRESEDETRARNAREKEQAEKERKA